MKTEQGNVIVLNRMYVGDYLSNNLGHEVINMYQADNGRHYLYLNAYGSFAEKWTSRVGSMLLVKYHSKDCVEIIGKAIGLKDLYEYKNDGNNKGESNNVINSNQIEKIKHISYGGVPLENIFAGNEKQEVYVTFEAEKVYKIKEGKSIFIHYLPQEPKNGKNTNSVEISSAPKKTELKSTCNRIDIYLANNKLALASLNQFFTEGDDFNILNDIIIDKKNEYKDFWVLLSKEDMVPKIFSNDYSHGKISLFEICQIQNDENRFSNALSYFMQCTKYNELWCDFFNKVLEIDNNGINNILSVTREELAEIRDGKIKKKLKKELKGKIQQKIKDINIDGGRIDLAIRTNDSLIIIENKIKSDINRVDGDCDGKQLRRYYNYANWLVDKRNENSKDKGKKLYFILLTPEYNKPDLDEGDNFLETKMKDVYKIVTYAYLHSFLDKNIYKFKDDENFIAFHNAMYRHTHRNVNDYLYYDMQDKFYRRIFEYNNKK